MEDRKKLLDDACGVRRFLNNGSELRAWIASTVSQFGAGEQSPTKRKCSVGGARSAHLRGIDIKTQRHDYHKTEIAGKEDRKMVVLSEGNDLTTTSSSSQLSVIQEELGNVTRDWDSLLAAWQGRATELEQAGAELAFERRLNQVLAWLENCKETMPDQIGESLGEVGALLRKHAEWTKMFTSKEDSVEDLKALTTIAGAATHPMAAGFDDQTNEVRQRYEDLVRAGEMQGTKFKDSLEYFDIVRDVDDTMAWTNDKLMVATDNAHLDPTNLRGKTSGHSTLASEVSSRAPVVEAICARGADMVSGGRDHGRPIQQEVDALSAHWASLEAAVSTKTRLLKEARVDVHLTRLFEEHDAWCDQIEAQLENTDLGTDLTSVTLLFKRHDLLEEEVLGQRVRVDETSKECADVQVAGNFKADAIKARSEAAQSKYATICDHVTRRGVDLNDAVKFQSFCKSGNDLGSRGNAAASRAASTDVGKTLPSVQSLVQRHVYLVNEAKGCWEQYEAVKSNGDTLIAEPHPFSTAISAKVAELKCQLEGLDKGVVDRETRLVASERAQLYLADAAAHNLWMDDRGPLLQNGPDGGEAEVELTQDQKYGSNIDATEPLLVKHGTLSNELSAVGVSITAAVEECAAMVDINHVDSDVLKPSGEALKARLDGLNKDSALRQKLLAETATYHTYVLDTTDALEWMAGELAQIVLDDIGKDQQDCEMLTDQYNARMLNIGASKQEYHTGLVNQGSDFIAVDHYRNAELKTRIDLVNFSWNGLQDAARLRDQMLQDAHIVHTFQLDADDVRGRVGEKRVLATVDSLGGDLPAAEALLRRHGALTHEVEAMEPQVNALVDRGNALIKSQPSRTAVLKEGTEEISTQWNELQLLLTATNDSLDHSKTFHAYAYEVDGRLAFIVATTTAMLADADATDVHTAELLVTNHKTFAADIAARADDIGGLEVEGTGLVKAGHPSAADLKTKIAELNNAYSNLKEASSTRERQLLLSHEYEEFKELVRQLNTYNTKHDLVLSSADVGDSLARAQDLIQEHTHHADTRTAHKELLRGMQLAAEKLLTQEGCPDAAAIATMRDETVNTVEILDGKAVERTTALEISLQLHQLVRDGLEADDWIAAALKVALDETFKDLTNLHVQSSGHGAFKSELAAQASMLDQLRAKATALSPTKHADQSAKIISEVEARWKTLGTAAEMKEKIIAQALGLAQCLREIEELTAQHESLLAQSQNPDIGASVADVEVLEQEWKSVDLDNEAHLKRGADLVAFGRSLGEDGHYDGARIEQCLAQLQTQFATLTAASEKRSSDLAASRVLEENLAMASEIGERLQTKRAHATVVDVVKDVESAERLQKGHGGLTRDVNVLEAQVETMTATMANLRTTYQMKGERVKQLEDELASHKKALSDELAERKTRLEKHLSVQVHLGKMRDQAAWIEEREQMMAASASVDSVAGAMAVVKRHRENAAELAARDAAVKELTATSARLVLENPDLANDIETELKMVNTQWEKASAVNESTDAQLRETYGLQILLRDADQIENWIQNQTGEAARAKDVGATVDEVARLIKAHAEFKSSIDTQEANMPPFVAAAQQLLDTGKCDNAVIIKRRDVVQTARAELVGLATEREATLAHSKDLQQYLRDMVEAREWGQEKLRVAKDGAYTEPTNLTVKQQKQAVFAAEISSNKERIEALSAKGQVLITGGCLEPETIKARAADLASEWSALVAATADKTLKTAQAVDEYDFHQQADDVLAYCAETTATLESKELGSNLAEAKMFHKRHKLLEADILAYSSQVDANNARADELVKGGNFRTTEIGAKQTNVKEMYGNLTPLIEARGKRLLESLELETRWFDIEVLALELDSWLGERETVVNISDLGVTSAENELLSRRHDNFIKYCIANKDRVSGVNDLAEKLAADGHVPAQQFTDTHAKAKSRWETILATAEIRKVQLAAKRVVLLFSESVDVTTAFIVEKQMVLSSSAVGDSVENAETLLRRHAESEGDTAAVGTTVAMLQKECAEVEEAQPTEVVFIKPKQTSLDAAWAELEVISKRRKDLLTASHELHVFLSTERDFIAWVTKLTSLIKSDNLGTTATETEGKLHVHKTRKADIDTKTVLLGQQEATANTLQQKGHMDAADIAKALAGMKEGHEALLKIWRDREENLNHKYSAIAHMNDLSDAEAWMTQHKAGLASEVTATSVQGVEQLLKLHEDLENSVAAQGDKFQRLDIVTEQEKKDEENENK
jgi:hypothetical protein